MAAWIETLSSGFVILMILSLVVILGGFLMDYAKSTEDTEPPEKESHLCSAFADFVIAAMWTVLWFAGLSIEPSWLLPVFTLLPLLAGLISLYRHFAALRQAN